jgi:hypothetical protein
MSFRRTDSAPRKLVFRRKRHGRTAGNDHVEPAVAVDVCNAESGRIKRRRCGHRRSERSARRIDHESAGPARTGREKLRSAVVVEIAEREESNQLRAWNGGAGCEGPGAIIHEDLQAAQQ